MSNISFVFLIPLCIILLAGCKEDDGELLDGELKPVEWTLINTGEQWINNRDFHIPAEGCEIQLQSSTTITLGHANIVDISSSTIISDKNLIEVPNFIRIEKLQENEIYIKIYGNELGDVREAILFVMGELTPVTLKFIQEKAST